MSRELVRFWKGSEGSYRELYIRGRIKDNVKYTVICDDGTVKEYLGNVPLGSCELEQMPFVDGVIGASAFKESFEKNPSSYKNKRILVGDDLAFDGDGKLLDEYTPTEGSDTPLWYLLGFGDDVSRPMQVIDFTDKSCRIKSLGMREYQVVDNMLVTYDAVIWHNANRI